MNDSDILYEIQTQIAECSSPIEIGEYWHFCDVFVRNIENQSFATSSVIAMVMTLVEKMPRGERFVYRPSSYKLEDYMISAFQKLNSEQDITSYLQSMFDLLKGYCQIFWFSFPLVERLFTFFNSILPWTQNHCSRNDIKSSCQSVFIEVVQTIQLVDGSSEELQSALDGRDTSVIESYDVSAIRTALIVGLLTIDTVIDDQIPYLTTIWKTSIRAAVSNNSHFKEDVHDIILTHFSKRIEWMTSRLTSSLQSQNKIAESGFPKFFLSLYLVYARTNQSLIILTPCFASFIESLFRFGDATLSSHWIGLSSQSAQILNSVQSMVDNCIKSIARSAVQSQQTDVLLKVLSSLSAQSYSCFRMFLAIEQQTKTIPVPTLLEAAQDASFSMMMTSSQPFIEVIQSVFKSLSPSQQAEALHQIYWAAVVGDQFMHRIVTKIFQVFMSDGKITYTPHLQIPLSVEENSRGYLSFLLECAFLLVAIQLRANTSPLDVISVADIFSGCLRMTSSDNQSKWIHFLLQGWKSSNCNMGDVYGMILAGLEWRELNDRMVRQKVHGILGAFKEQLQTGRSIQIWCVERVLHGIRGYFTGKEGVEPLCQHVLGMLNSSLTAFDRLTLLRITQRLLPYGIASAQLSPYLITVVNQLSYFDKEYKDESCVVIAQILASVAGMMIPRNDLGAVESSCSSLLNWVLRGDDRILSLAIHSILTFINTFAGNVNNLIKETVQKNRLTTMLKQLKEKTVRQVNLKSRKEARRKREEKIRGLSKEDDSLNGVLKSMKQLFQELVGIIPQLGSNKQNLCVSKDELEEWKHTIDSLL